MSDFLEDLKQQLADNLERACYHLENKIKEKINRDEPYHISKGPKGRWYKGDDPSLPGEPPKKVRGDLQRSITHEVIDDVGRVGTNLDYGLYLEFGTQHMAARPYFRATLDEEARTLAEILSQPTK